MLSVTVDNASSNDTLVTELADRNAHFAGDMSRTRCFLHIVNLVAKSLIREFDAPKSKASMADDPELVKLTADIEIEDARTADEDPNKDAESEDNEEGWVDELYLLEEEEREQLMDSIRPLRLVLAKVTVLNVNCNSLALTDLPHSSGNSHTKSSIRQQSFCQPGRQSSRT
jgi:hypothetical protein